MKNLLQEVWRLSCVRLGIIFIRSKIILNNFFRNQQERGEFPLQNLFRRASRALMFANAALMFSAMVSAPGFSKERVYYRHADEPAYTTVYEPNEPRYEYRETKYAYDDSGNYLIGYLHHLWYWFWCNIVLILLIVLVVWLVCCWFHVSRVRQEFAAARAVTTDAQALFLLNTLERRLV
jgi:hypothetical protein